MTEFREGQIVRIKVTAFGDSDEARDIKNRGQAAELLEEMGTENGETMWRSFVDATADEVYLLGSELEPLEVQSVNESGTFVLALTDTLVDAVVPVVVSANTRRAEAAEARLALAECVLHDYGIYVEGLSLAQQVKALVERVGVAEAEIKRRNAAENRMFDGLEQLTNGYNVHEWGGE